MKAHILLLLLSCLLLPARAENPARLEVHEWGTITVLSGSDGEPLKWFQGAGFLDEVPHFVRVNGFGGKDALWLQGATVRMETPVIYFYPEKPMRVTAHVSFAGGQITEWFPEAQLEPAKSPGADRALKWAGDLLPPKDAGALAQIPEVAPGKGDHYRHARDVPGAWIFRSTVPMMREEKDPLKGKDADKFIFYRGKSLTVPPYQVQADNDGTVTLRHWGAGGAIPIAFALSVKDGTAHWSKMPPLAAAPALDQTALSAQVKVKHEGEGVPVAKAAEMLTPAMIDALVESGLTRDEARAMVATWDGHWFREAGTRVLAILPREWVDSVLPLTITPTPKKLTRVFVARLEMLTPERESTLLTLLNDPAGAEPDKAEMKRFEKLELGRFAQGGLLRAQQMQTQRMNEQFWKLHFSGAKTAAK